MVLSLPNDQGTLFEKFLLEGRWYAPTTMSWCHQSGRYTWAHPRGHRLRRDYVLCSLDALQWCKASWVDVAHDAGFSHEDRLSVWRLQDGGNPPHTHPGLNGMVAPFWIQCDAGNFKMLSTPCQFLLGKWHVDDHAKLFQDHVYHLATQFFAKRRGERVRPRLAESIMALIYLKRSVLDYGRKSHLMQDASFRAELCLLELQVRACVQHDQANFYASLVDQLAHDGSLYDFRSVYRLLSRLGGRPKHRTAQSRPLPLLRDAHGQPVATFQQQQRLWLHRFAQIEGGCPWLARQMPACLGLPADTLDLAAVPTATQLEGKIRKMKRGKAPGPDGLPFDVCKAGAFPIIQLVLALTTKSALHAREHSCWRGGRLIPLHKDKLPRSDPQGYRSIFVSNFATKLYHSVLRDHLVDAWQRNLRHIQFGGRSGCGTDTPHLLLQQHF